MSTLVWGVKESLLSYVRRMPDGAITADDGARIDGNAVSFPGDGLRFSGSVTLTGHGGMMHVVLSAPQLVREEETWSLSIEDPDAPEGRLRFATVGSFDGARGSDVRLTEDGADLFFGPYTRGTPLDDLRVVE
ncbi:HtaA domain-containing protein [Microbacterium tumbae]